MYKQLKENKFVEKISAFALFALAMMLIKINLNHDFNIHNYFWIFSLMVLSVTQFSSIKMDITIWRIVVAWISGIVWTWFAIVSDIHLVYIPALIIGSLNIYVSILLSNKIHFNWFDFTKD